jgi:hypothetical protein
MKIEIPFRAVFLLAAFAAVATTAGSRTVELEDFAHSPAGALHLGGEYPGAQGTKTALAADALDGACEAGVRVEMDTTAGGRYVAYELGGLSVPEGTRTVSARVRCSLPDARVFVRFRDSAKTVHYQGANLGPAGEWQTVTLALDDFEGYWDGKNERAVEWPVTSLGVGVEAANARCTFDLASLAVETDAPEEALPTYDIALTPAKVGGAWYPDDTAVFDLTFRRGRPAANASVAVVLKDWRDRVVTERIQPPDATRIEFAPEDFGGRYGGFEVSATFRDADAERTAAVSFGRFTGPNPKPCPWVGVNTWGIWNGHPFRDDPAWLDLLAAAGFSRVRTELWWHGVESRPGEYAVPERFETATDELSRRGIETHLVLSGAVNKSAYPDEPWNPRAYADCMAWLARRYRGRIGTFEVHNEPQNTGVLFWFCHGGDHVPGTPETLWGESSLKWIRPLMEEVALVRKAVKEAVPEASVSLPAMDVQPTLVRMLEEGLVGDPEGDIVSIHPYCHDVIRPEQGSWFFTDPAGFRRLLEKHGGARRVMISEIGWTTVQENRRHAFVGNYPRATRVDQAQYVIRQYLLSRQLGIENSMVHLFADWGKDPYYTEHNFGLLDYDFNPKPAYFAVAFMTRLLGDMEPDGELGETPANFRVARFAKFRDAERKKAVLAAWSVYGEGVRWKLPDEYARPAKVYDLMGNECSAEVLGDGILVLSEAPVYLVFERSAIAR